MTNNKGREPIAVVGYSYRLPGVQGEALWDALLAGRDLVSSVEEGRWAQESLLHPRKGEPGTAYTFAAGSIGDVSGFDAAFFGISPREAEQMDPQQRVLLELTWEALEHAGIPPAALRGRRCGVYVGLSSVDYSYRRADDMASIDATTMTGNAGSIAANRLSYFFDLHGPSMAVDTACSSSLVALHQACQSLRGGETEAAVVGGISLHLHPYAFVGFSKASMLSRRGRCSVFDAAGDGYVRSEGGAVLLLKPLHRALAEGDRVLGVIAETGVNSDGRKNGLTVPSHVAQAALLREVYGRAGIAPEEIDYFEAHGTGTAVGDPLETRAIGEAIGQMRPAQRPLPIGSIKANVGHLEAAAGMAGLVKSLHVLRHRVVPGNRIGTPNPNIDFAGWNLAPVTEVLELPRDRRLVVGVSAFGFGGTNAHVVLTSFEGGIGVGTSASATALTPAPLPLAGEGRVPSRAELPPPPLAVEGRVSSQAELPPLMLSARSAAALQDTARLMARHLRLHPELDYYDIAFSAARHRDVHVHRLSVTGADRLAVAQSLDQFADAGSAPGVVKGRFRADASAPAFVYSGNGSQWAGMGLQLLEEDAVFRAAVEEVDALYMAGGEPSIVADLRADAAADRFSLTEVAQPALFAIQVGLTRMLEQRGVRPRAVAGHSVGEVAAAWASGALTLEAAVRVIHERSAQQAGTRGKGCMTAVALGEADAVAVITSFALGERLAIAAINSPHSVTVAGDTDAMARLEAILAQRRVASQRLGLAYAFHSPAMDSIRAGLMRALKGLKAGPSRIPMYSTVTGSRMEGAQTAAAGGASSAASAGVASGLGAEYWWRNVREPVRFEAAVRAMIEDGINTFVEVGPRAVLASYLNDIGKQAGARRDAGSAASADAAAPLVLAGLTRNEPGTARVRWVVDQLELTGALRDPARLFPVPGRYVDLPHYPWQRERHWHPSSPESLGLLARASVHPLLGYALAGDALHWENHLDTARLPLYADHAVGGAAVFPAAGFVEMALAAWAQWQDGPGARGGRAADASACLVIEDLEILAPLLLERDRSRTVRLKIDAGDGRFTINSRDRIHDDPWQLHAVGRLVADAVAATQPPVQIPARNPDVSGAAHYDLARSLGLDYGPAFQSVAAVWFVRGAVLGAIATPRAIAEGEGARAAPGGVASALLHPCYLDGAFQLLADAAVREHGAHPGAGAPVPAFLPVRIERLELTRPHVRVTAARLVPGAARNRSRRSMLADFTLFDESGAMVACARGVRFRAANLQRGNESAARAIAVRAVAMPRPRSARAAALPAIAELAQRCARHLHAPARVVARLRYAQEVEPLLDALCAAFAERALRELTAEAGAGAPIEPERLVTAGTVAPAALPLLRNLVQMLVDDGVIAPARAPSENAGAQGPRFQWQPDAAMPAPEDIWSSLIADYPEYAAITTHVGAAGLHLAERLRAPSGAPRRGSIPPGAGASAWTDGCTQDEAAAITAALGEVLGAAVQAQPVHGRLRVLRFLSAAPRHGLEAELAALDADRCEVILGAPSQQVLDEVHGRSPLAAELGGRILDLDRAASAHADASTAGSDAAGFDLIVAGEGLADAPDAGLRLARLRGMLRGDGTLVVLEQYPARALDLVFGLDANWWREYAQADVPEQDDGADPASAVPGTSTRSRLRGPGAWTQALAQADFLDIQVVTDVPDAPTGPYLLLARAGASAAPAVAAPAPAGKTWLLLQDPAGYSADLGTALAAELRQRGQSVVRVITGNPYVRHAATGGDERFMLDPASATHWDRLVADLRGAGREPQGWIHLAGLDPSRRGGAGTARALRAGGAAKAAQAAAEREAATPAGRAARLEARAAVLMAWLQACSRHGLRPDGWVVGAQAGRALLPPGALEDLAPEGVDKERRRDAPGDPLRDAALWGLTRVAIQEFTELRLRWVDLTEPLPFDAHAPRLAEEMIEPDDEDEILLTRQGRYVPRIGPRRADADARAQHAPADAAGAAPLPRFVLDFHVPGPFRNLGWRTEPEAPELAAGEVEIEVRATGLNFRDVMYAMGLLPDEAVEAGFSGPTLGMEVAGVVTRVAADVGAYAPGDEVMAFAAAGFTNRVRTPAQAVTRKPAGWTFAAAASVPTAFFTAHYALVELARIREGERLLIHGAAGGVGIAAIQLARPLGVEVFATAGSDEKRDFVRLLGADHVFDSRAAAFDDQILLATGGAGVDVVLNSLAGDAIRRNLRLLRPFGRLLELGKRDFYENARVGLRPFRNNLSYFGIDADQLLGQRPEIAQRVFAELMRMFADGSLRPLPHQCFCATDVAAAFRHMRASRHIGKIVVTMPPGFDPLSGERRRPPAAPVALRADATYLVTGGLSGFGLSTARWLARRGARHLALLGRRGAAGAEAQEALEQLAAAGVTVQALACDVADGAALSAALAAIRAQLPPIRGIVHAAMVIEDALIRDMEREQLHRVLAPKIRGALNLHEATRAGPLAQTLDFFVLYSSATTLFGNPGQAAYVAANTALEALASERRALGLPATCIGWGPIGDAGYLARNERVRDALVGRIGGRALPAGQALDALDHLLGARGNVGWLELDWSVLGRFLPAAQAPKFSELARMADRGLRAGRGEDRAADVRRRLEALAGAELSAALTEIVRGEIAQILRIAPDRIETGASLFDMGMDSLMAVELATSIEARLGIRISALSLSDGPTVERVVARIQRQLRPDDAGAGAAPEAGGGGTNAADQAMSEQVRAVAAQHASEVSDDMVNDFGSQIGSGGAAPLSLMRGSGGAPGDAGTGERAPGSDSGMAPGGERGGERK
jgi:acyl transferase domain-containing protein/NADPH:quinone reductase-like Zn-dependent oxidoreductase/NAD(P)-dependent dehydrogenase (short-subunit alcohol dehydrogenase family)/acyl carrier protein